MQDHSKQHERSGRQHKSTSQSSGAEDQTSEKQARKVGDLHSEHALMRSLMRELFQAEQSAQRQCRAEARRFQGTPPGRALEAVARHADAVEEELPVRARHHDLPVSKAGKAVGNTFSMLRRGVVDLFMDAETSYRATLLGLRHGLDVLMTLRAAAVAADDQELADWCERIRQARAPLIEELAQQLAWFAQHPEQAVAQVGRGMVARGIGALKGQLSRVQAALASRTRIADKPA